MSAATAATVATVVPTFNEGERLSAFLRDWAALGVAHATPAVQVIVVDDGGDREHEIVQRRGVEEADSVLRRAGSAHSITYVRAPQNQGKGAAIRLGWNQADPDSDWLGFIDADGAIPAREYWRVAVMLPESAADGICGSRVKMAGRTVERSLFRHLQGRVFATCVEELFHLGFYDTQCGFKFFRGSTLRPLLPRLREDRWLLDVEVLDLMNTANVRFAEVPVDCHQHGSSSLVLGIDPLRMAARLFSLRRRLHGAPGNRQ